MDTTPVSLSGRRTGRCCHAFMAHRFAVATSRRSLPAEQRGHPLVFREFY